MALLLGVALRLASWWGRAYAHDDFMIGYTAWMRAQGAIPERDSYLLIYTPLTDALAPLFRLFPDSLVPIDAGRFAVLAASLGLLALGYRIARRLGASPEVALAAVALASWQADFTRRVSDLRTDPFAALLLVSAIALLLSPRFGARAGLAGLLYGVAIPLSIKQLLAGPFLLLAVALFTREKKLPACARFVAGAATFPLLFALARVLELGWKGFIGPWIAYVGGGRGAVHADRSFVLDAVTSSPLTFLLIALGALGWLLGLDRATLFEERNAGAAYTLVLGAYLAAFLLLNPYVFPYNFTLFMPLLAPVAAGLGRLLAAPRLPSLARVGLFTAATLLPVLEGAPATAATFLETNARVRDVLRWMWAATDPDERVFDFLGLHVGRRGVRHWWIYAADLPRYRAGGWYSLSEEWASAHVTLAITNRRLLWMNASDRSAFDARFVPLDHCLFTPGRRVTGRELAGGPLTVDLPESGSYRVTPADAPGLLLDGTPAGRRATLAKGPHRLEMAEGARPPEEVVLAYTTSKREAATLPCPVPGPLFYSFE